MTGDLTTEILTALLVLLNAAYLWETRKMRQQGQAQLKALEEANSALSVERYASVMPYLAFSSTPKTALAGTHSVCDVELTNAGLGPAFRLFLISTSDWIVESMPLRDDLVPQAAASWRLSALSQESKMLTFRVDYVDVFDRKLSVAFTVVMDAGEVVQVEGAHRAEVSAS